MRFLAATCLLSSVFFVGCATRPHTYLPPDATKLKTSTTRVSTAVAAAHASANKARTTVSAASAMAKHAKTEVAKIKNVAAALVQEIADLDSKLTDAQAQQTELDNHLREADVARAQVEKDKADYFANAKKLADQATAENAARIKAERSLSWYRWHWYLGFIILGGGIILCIVIAILKFTGRLALKMPLLL